jgi:predicted metal-dependent hydrolase
MSNRDKSMARSLPEQRHDYVLAGRQVPVTLQRSKRRSIGLKITSEGLAVTLPVRFPLTELDAILHRKAGWIVSKLDELAAQPGLAALGEGSSVDWLGEPHNLRIGFGRGSVTADEIRLATDQSDAIPATLERLMRREARGFLGERLALWAGRLQLHYREFKLSGAGTRWGSCSANGAIRLNWRLMQAPLPVIDYVVIHELCHLVELNHSERFWALVASACPDWKHKRDWLKHHGSRYFAW